MRQETAGGALGKLPWSQLAPATQRFFAGADIAEILAFSLPMRMRFRNISQRAGLLLRGPAGWAEFSPFWEYGPPEAAAWLRSALDQATCAPPTLVREQIPINITVPVTTPEQATELINTASAATDIPLTAKVKVADPRASHHGDEARLAAVRAALGPHGKVRIDANGAWDLETALELLPRLDRAAGGLEYAEQPCQTIAELATLRRRLDIPIAADELVRRAVDPLAVARAQAADVLVIKVQPLGGVRAALQIADQTDLPVVVSSALDTSVGIAAGLHLAGALPQLPYACGLGTVRLFTSDIAQEPLIPATGFLPATARPEVDRDLLDQVPLPRNAVAHWASRLDEVVAAVVA